MCELIHQENMTKNFPKENPNNSNTPGDQMYLDISSMAKASSGGNRHWALMVDEATKYKKSFFPKKKNDRIEVIIDWLKELKNKYKIKVQQRIRMDIAGGIKMLAKSCDQNEMGIKSEYTAPRTPQQNEVVERSFVTLIGRGRAMMNHARFTVKKREEMWCETAQTATMLDDVLVQEKDGKPPHTQFYGEDPKYAKYLRMFGEIGVTAISSNKVERTKLDLKRG